jgi:N4-gp56 family major capsid protein
MIYGAGNGVPRSSIGTQPIEEYWLRKAVEDRVGYDYFSQLADVREMPKYHGKKIIRTIHVPLLDDRNVSPEGGIDSAGNPTTASNIYGSSRDVNTITTLLPRLGEMGGRVNRVSFTRLQVEGTFENFGFFWEYTKDAEQFDSESDLIQWNTRETYKGVAQLYEDTLQLDLLDNAGTIQFGGDATQDIEVTGNTGSVPSVVTYDGLMKLSDKLDDLDVPYDTTIIKGSRMIDTKVVANARYCYIGTHTKKTLMKLVDYHGNPAYEPVERYADAGSIANGEMGKIGNFRFINVGKYMMKWEHAGADVAVNAGYRSSLDPADNTEKYDIYPMLVVGADSFTTISFKSGTSGRKFDYFDQKPRSEGARSLQDPYGKQGFTVAEWYYGSLFYRPERIALIKTVAEK